MLVAIELVEFWKGDGRIRLNECFHNDFDIVTYKHEKLFQAPSSMKSILSAAWLLTTAFGNLIVVIISEMKLYDNQVSEYRTNEALKFYNEKLLIFRLVAP